MRNTIRLIVILLFVHTSFQLSAQHLKQNLVDKYYNSFAYYKALDYYKELASVKHPEPKNIRRTAECYHYLNNLENAGLYYEKLIKTDSANNNDLYNYSQVLKSLKNYTKANEYIKKFQQSYPIVSKKHKDYLNYFTALKNDSILYSVTNSDINSEENDFCPILYNNDFYFASSRYYSSYKENNFSRDGSLFLEYYKTTYKDGKYSNINSICTDMSVEFHEGPATLSPDGNTLYITVNYPEKEKASKQVNLKIFILKKDANGCWKKSEEFPFNNADYSVGHPALSPDGTIMYFVSNMPGGYGNTDLYETHLDNNKWTTPTNLGDLINTEGREMFPSVYSDGTLFFASDGHAGLGGLDIYFVLLDQDLFFIPQNLGYPINSSFDDFGFLLNEDTKSGFLSSNRPGGKGKDDIYNFKSSVFMLPEYHIEGITKNKYTQMPISKCLMMLHDQSGILIDSLRSDENGQYKLQLFSKKKYQLETIKEGYKIDKQLFYIDSLTINTIKDIELQEDLVNSYKLVGQVKDNENKLSIKDVSVSIKDNVTGIQIFKSFTNGNGYFDMPPDYFIKSYTLNYTILLEKTGYSPKTILFNQVVDKSGIFMINDFFDLNLISVDSKQLIGNIPSLIYDFKSIFFDINEFDIKENEKKELDKIAEILNNDKGYKLEIISTTDCRGSYLYNMALSKKRSVSVANYLNSKGVDFNRLKIKYVGETELVDNCSCEYNSSNACSEKQNQLNRKSSFKLISLIKK